LVKYLCSIAYKKTNEPIKDIGRYSRYTRSKRVDNRMPGVIGDDRTLEAVGITPGTKLLIVEGAVKSPVDLTL
jgi:hypothetical protein